MTADAPRGTPGPECNLWRTQTIRRTRGLMPRATVPRAPAAATGTSTVSRPGRLAAPARLPSLATTSASLSIHENRSSSESDGLHGLPPQIRRVTPAPTPALLSDRGPRGPLRHVSDRRAMDCAVPRADMRLRPCGPCGRPRARRSCRSRPGRASRESAAAPRGRACCG